VIRLVASMNVRNEVGRYLRQSIPHLLEFCDEVRVQDDGSDDGTFEWLSDQEGVAVKRNDGFAWREHEGHLHQQLLDFTMEGRPTHILAIDADEFVVDGAALRGLLADARGPRARSFGLRMCEIWKRNGDPWQMRLDGGWRPHDVAIAYRVPPQLTTSQWKIWGRKLAGGRVPRAIRADQRRGRLVSTGIDILHLGWSNPSEREARHARYVELDGGNYHAGSHLDSILWDDDQVELEAYDAPRALRALFPA
jgi:glycosyltransferase involved in cell wall biosynthesis